MTTLFIPSPSNGVWHLGPIPVRGYALCIIAGIIAAIWIGERRWAARGGLRGEVTDLALWAVPFGVVGGRIYHVITDHDLYFGNGNSPIEALYVWRGGLGIWGAIALGGVGVWIGAKTKGIKVPPVLDAMAPGVLVAQAIGRWGNWFNQELFGKPSTRPWALKIDPENRPPGYENFATFQPTFLYECLWDLGAFGFVIWADRRFKLGHGRVVALYVMAYTAGRGWIETLRIDDVEYQHVLGLRLNVWTSIVLFCLATAYFVVAGRQRPGRETEMYTDQRLAVDRAAAGGAEPPGGEPAEAGHDTTREASTKPPGKEPTADEGSSPGAATRAGVATALLDHASPEPAPEPDVVPEAVEAPPPETDGATKPPATKAPATKTPATKTPATKTPATKTPATKTPAKKAPAKKAPAKKAALAKKAAVAKEAGPAKKAAAAKKGPAKRAAPAKKAPAATEETPPTKAPPGEPAPAPHPNTEPAATDQPTERTPDNPDDTGS